MIRPVIILSVVFGFIFLFESGIARKCYICNSYFQQDCADHFNNITHHLQECKENETMCRKIVQEVYYNEKWNTRYIRQCAKSGEVGGDEGRQCVERTGTYKVKMRYCHCDNQDGCNSASSVHLSTALAFMSAFVTVRVLFNKLL